jgi:hypothetical protein
MIGSVIRDGNSFESINCLSASCTLHFLIRHLQSEAEENNVKIKLKDNFGNGARVELTDRKVEEAKILEKDKLQRRLKENAQSEIKTNDFRGKGKKEKKGSRKI